MVGAGGLGGIFNFNDALCTPLCQSTCDKAEFDVNVSQMALAAPKGAWQ